MYLRFFGLKQEPFSLAPDPRYLYMSKRHREALAHLLYGVGGGGGFVLLSGEIGAGKTTVCRCFLEQIPKRSNVAYIFNPKLTVIELLRSICDEFRIPYRLPRGEAATVKAYVDPLNDFLLKTHAVGQNNVLIIDEAQNLSADVLEQLRLLTNLETNERKLLQIVLIGQPELRTMLERPELEQLAQRVIARFHLKALSSKETEHYIRHRLSVAGMTRSIPFDRKAVERIHEFARGVPRRINLLCDRAMLGAYAHGKQLIDASMIEKAAREVFGKSEPAGPDRSDVARGAGRGLVVATALGLAALVVFAGYGAWRKFTDPGAAMASSPAASAASSARAATRAGSGAIAAVAAGGSAAGAGGVAGATRSAEAASAGAPGGRSSAAAATPAAGARAASAAPSTASGAGKAALVEAPGKVDGGADLGAVTTGAALKAAVRDENASWRELARLWGVDPGEAATCAAVARQQVRCSRFFSTLPMIRVLGRPGWMNVRDEAGRSGTVLLLALGDRNAVLSAEGRTMTVPVGELAKAWQGEFGTLWRSPEGYVGAVSDGASGPAVDRLAAQLAQVAGEPAPTGRQIMNAALREKVTRFQATHGLSPVGRAGPTTFMQLNRLTGVPEPRLGNADVPG
ncbi:MAG TPA: AAA family ATPase [Caldimonas sp.]|jgi:general secretion pathway protein A|nr:AAA family ATPase [Caldimonas sp.]HEX2539935.1 AAA family ATPase [Caldimonas sp.]